MFHNIGQSMALEQAESCMLKFTAQVYVRAGGEILTQDKASDEVSCNG